MVRCFLSLLYFVIPNKHYEMPISLGARRQIFRKFDEIIIGHYIWPFKNK